jgi:hypothetical protein
MASSELHTAYPRDLLYERSLLLAAHESERPELPFVEGALVDRATTKSHEQGVTLAPDGQSAILSIVDTTGFEVGGPADIHGLFNRSTQYENHFVRKRLFPDPILYKKLSLDNPAGTPVVAFRFKRFGEGWSLDTIDRALFFATSTVERVRGEKKPELQQLELDLSAQLYEWIAEQESAGQIGFIPHQGEGHFSATSPLRNWSDFKNLQLIRDLYIDRSTKSVLPLDSIEAIKRHLSSEDPFATIDQAASVFAGAKQPLETKLQRILGTGDISRFKLSEIDFRLLCNAILNGEVQADRTISIATAIGLVSVDSETSATVGGVRIKTSDTEEALITLLQATDHAQDKAVKVRGMLHDLGNTARDVRVAAEEAGADVVALVLAGAMSRARQRRTLGR